jgi:hypothetical protein
LQNAPAGSALFSNRAKHAAFSAAVQRRRTGLGIDGLVDALFVFGSFAMIVGFIPTGYQTLTIMSSCRK